LEYSVQRELRVFQRHLSVSKESHQWTTALGSKPASLAARMESIRVVEAADSIGDSQEVFIQELQTGSWCCAIWDPTRMAHSLETVRSAKRSLSDSTI
jgi:hypothetical protein